MTDGAGWWSKRRKIDPCPPLDPGTEIRENFSKFLMTDVSKTSKNNEKITNHCASSHACTKVFGISLILQNLSQHLNPQDLKNCRLVCHQWNTSFTNETDLLKNVIVHLTDAQMTPTEFGATMVPWKNFDLTLGPLTLATLKGSSCLWFYPKLKWSESLTLRATFEGPCCDWKFDLCHLLHLKWILRGSGNLKHVHLTDSLLRHLPHIFFTFRDIQSTLKNLTNFTVSMSRKAYVHDIISLISSRMTILGHQVLRENLRTLTINNVTIARRLMMTKINFPQLKSLAMTMDHEDACDFFKDFLNCQPPLYKIEFNIETLYNNNFPPQITQAIANNQSAKPKLKVLKVWTNNSVFLNDLNFLCHLKALEELTFEVCGFKKFEPLTFNQQAGARATLLEFLSKVPESVQKLCVTVLESDYTFLGGGGVHSILECMGGFDPLKFSELNLKKFNNLNDTALRVIFREFKMLKSFRLPTCGSEYTDLALMGRRMEDEENEAQFPISDLKRLQTLDMGGSYLVTNASVIHAIKFSRLTFLNLSGLENVDALGVRWALKNNPNLRFLRISVLAHKPQCFYKRDEIRAYLEKGDSWTKLAHHFGKWWSRTDWNPETDWSKRIWRWRPATIKPYPNLEALVVQTV